MPTSASPEMRLDMADIEVCAVGTVVECVTCHDKKIAGEVIAFDVPSKTVLLRSKSAVDASRAGVADADTCKALSDVHLVNLGLLRSINVVAESTKCDRGQPPILDHAKLHQRYEASVKEKKDKVANQGVGVTPEAQQLYNLIRKTLPIRWEDKNIIVMNDVRISPPYMETDVRLIEGRDESKSTQAVDHVIKLVKKHTTDKKDKASSL